MYNRLYSSLYSRLYTRKNNQALILNIILLCVIFITGCSLQKEEAKSLTRSKDKTNSKIKYYRIWNDKENKAYDELKAGALGDGKYYELLYNDKGKPIKLIKHIKRKRTEKVKLIYYEDGNLKRKLVYKYDESGKKQSYKIYDYAKSGALKLETAYSKDIKLLDSIEYDKLYLDTKSHYDKVGNISKKEWYYKEEAPGELYFVDKYLYKRQRLKFIKSYDNKDSLIQIKEYDKYGKIIKNRMLK